VTRAAGGPGRLARGAPGQALSGLVPRRHAREVPHSVLGPGFASGRGGRCPDRQRRRWSQALPACACATGLALAATMAVNAPPSGPPDEAASPPVVTVASDGTGDFASVAEGVAAAAGGALVRVASGVYSEALVVTEPVHISGAGPGQTVLAPLHVVTGSVGDLSTALEAGAVRDPGKYCLPVLVVNVDGEVLLSGLTLTGVSLRPAGMAIPSALLVLVSGRLRLQECVVVGNWLGGIHVGPGTSLSAERCLVAGALDTGIWVADAEAELVDCDVRRCTVGLYVTGTSARCRASRTLFEEMHSGVIHTGGALALCGCRTQRTPQGIYGGEGASLGIEDSVFWRCSSWSVFGDWGRLLFRANTVANADGLGISVEDGAVRVERSVFYDCKAAVEWRYAAGEAPPAGGHPSLERGCNLFWGNDQDVVGVPVVEGAAGHPEQLPLSGDSVVGDPLFADSALGDLRFLDGSPALAVGAGAPDPLPPESRWPVQPQEEFICAEAQRHSAEQHATERLQPPAVPAPATAPPSGDGAGDVARQEAPPPGEPGGAATP
jgi:hypothetical protein